MKRPAADPYAYPPRGLDRDGAARYLGLDPAGFDDLIKFGKLPRPRRLNGTPIWDRLQIEAAFETFPNETGDVVLKGSSGPIETAHPKVYTVETLAERWRCSGTHVRNMIKRGDLPAFSFGGKLVRIRTVDVIAYESGQPMPAQSDS